MSEAVESPAIWSLPAGVTLLWQAWDDDETIVYNRASGQTHLIDAFSAELLREFESKPRSIDEISLRLATELELNIEAVKQRAHGS